MIGVLRSVFSQSPSDAFEVMIAIEKRGKAVCGTYPRAVADALLQAAQLRIRGSGHQLVITAEAGSIRRSRFLCPMMPAEGSWFSFMARACGSTRR